MQDITEVPQNTRLYGGAAGIKIGVTINDKNWLVKYPGNLKEKQLKNINLSYSNSPVCEYLGSHIYEWLDIPVHQTQLAIRGNKIVVMCEDFRGNKNLYHFSELKATFEPAFLTLDGIVSDGCGTDLDEALLVIDKHPMLANLKGVKDRFWEMFVVDFIIGNPDRNNGNWGILVENNDIELAPVFDCGNCLCDKWDDDKMKLFLESSERFDGEAFGSKVCFYTQKGKRIRPYKFLRNTGDTDCLNALNRIMFLWEQNDVFDKFVGFMKLERCISEVQFQFYSAIVARRIEKLKEIIDRNLHGE